MVRHKGVLIKALDFTRPQVVNFEEEVKLSDLYEALGVDTVDMVSLPEDIIVWVDDNGLITSGNLVLNYSIEIPDGTTHEIQLAGNALFLSSNEQGETIGLSVEQYNWINKNIKIKPIGITR